MTARKFSVLEAGSPRYVLARKKAISKSVYMGIALAHVTEGQIEWACSSYDGNEFETHEDVFHVDSDTPKVSHLEKLNDKIIKTVHDYANSHNYRIQAVCIGCDEATAKVVAEHPELKDPIRSMCTRFWFDIDAAPCIYTLRG
ncbi:hypothetical protein LPJ73_004728, partial [Coemansia sp. RSA 2703]